MFNIDNELIILICKKLGFTPKIKDKKIIIPDEYKNKFLQAIEKKYANYRKYSYMQHERYDINFYWEKL